MSNKLGLCSPWVDFYKKVDTLFKKDPEVKVDFDQDNYTVKLYVDNAIKADALTKLLPAEKEFGNVVLKIEVVPADNSEESRIDLFRKAFNGNPAVDAITTAGPIGYDFVIFAKEVVQYYNDDLADAYGYRSTLYQELALEVFGIEDNVLYSTTVTEEE